MSYNDVHLRVAEQVLKNDDYENVFIKGSFKLPALIIQLDKPPVEYRVKRIKNYIKKEGSHYFYIKMGKMPCLGKVDFNIETINFLEQNFKEFGLSIYEVIDDTNQHKVTTMDMIGTIQLNIDIEE